MSRRLADVALADRGVYELESVCVPSERICWSNCASRRLKSPIVRIGSTVRIKDTSDTSADWPPLNVTTLAR